jgi:predicted O-linked N-acetylglucosamine transferase (SPINDLY family)
MILRFPRFAYAGVGMTAWLADSVTDYINLAQQHSASLDNLALLRQQLRTQLANSSLCDEAAFAVDFARCIKQMVEQTLA